MEDVFVPSSIGPDATRKKMMFDKHFVQLLVMGVRSKTGCLAHRESAGKGSYAWFIEDSVLEAALMANVYRRESATSSSPTCLWRLFFLRLLVRIVFVKGVSACRYE